MSGHDDWPSPKPVPAIGDWATNAHMISDVAKLGYLDGHVLDATYGDGAFWTIWEPDLLTASDLYKDPAPIAYASAVALDGAHRWDYKHLPVKDNAYASVVFDPPYKMSGTPALGEFDETYGIDKPVRYQERLVDIVQGAIECFRACSRYTLIKCQDQVVSGQVVWQTDLLTLAIKTHGGRKVDRFDYVHFGRPQPPGRTQVHARRNHSTLLVFTKKGNS